MDTREIAWRIRSVLRDQVDIARIPLGLIPRIPAQQLAAFDAFEPGFRCSPVTRNNWQANERRFSQRWLDSLVARANEISENRLSYFDLDAVDHGNPFNWHRDHSAGVDCPIRLSVLTDYRDFKTNGDCKLVWEPNRHHQLLVLARAYVATGNPGYASKIAELLRSWIDDNPFGYGMNWKSPLEIGVRLINWVWTIDLIRGSGALDDRLWHDIQQTAYVGMWDAHRKFSRGSSANNHLIGEAAGVYIASCYFDGFPSAAQWQLDSKAVLEREIIAQTYSDGCTREHAFGYQFFVIQFFMLCLHAGKQTGDSFSRAFRDRLGQMYRFVDEISHDTGRPPNMGDADDGYVLDLGDKSAAVTEFLGLGALILNDDSLTQSGSESEFWLLGPGECDALRPVDRASGTVFEESGYAIIRSKRAAIFMDCADLGYGPIAAHGHADCLSFSLSVDGQPVLIDPGTYDYFTYPEWRNHFRETRSHNTVEIDGVSQSQNLGPFLWGKRAEPTPIVAHDDADFLQISCSHNGYQRLDDAVRHYRTIALHKDYVQIRISDRFECVGCHNAVAFLHLDPLCKANRLSEKSCEIVTDEGRTLKVSTEGTIVIVTASADDMTGWVSTGYHAKQPSVCIKVYFDVVGDTLHSIEIAET